MTAGDRTVKAYVLMDCKPGTANRILDEIRKLDGVKDADSLWGRYEIITVVEVPDMDTLEVLVCEQIKAIEGVLNTMTQIAKRRASTR